MGRRCFPGTLLVIVNCCEGYQCSSGLRHSVILSPLPHTKNAQARRHNPAWNEHAILYPKRCTYNHLWCTFKSNHRTPVSLQEMGRPVPTYHNAAKNHAKNLRPRKPAQNSHTPDTKNLHTPDSTTSQGAQVNNGCMFSKGGLPRGSGTNSKGVYIRSKGGNISTPSGSYAWTCCLMYTFTSIPTIPNAHGSHCTMYTLTQS